MGKPFSFSAIFFSSTTILHCIAESPAEMLRDASATIFAIRAKSPKTHCAFRFKSQESQAFAQDVQTRFKTSWTQLSKQNQGPTTLMPPLELQAKVTPLGELAV
ncbi:hypothetical protein V6N13_051667 [Hibiscus sabdariffa]